MTIFSKRLGSRWGRPCALLAVFLTIMHAGFAIAQDKPAVSAGQPTASPQPQITTASYQDWMLRCVAPSNQPRFCEILQSIQIQGQSTSAAVIALGKVDAKGPLRLVVQLPTGVWLPAGATFQPGEKATPLNLEFKRCQQGCFAEVELDEPTIKLLRAVSGTGTLSFKDGAQQPIKFPVSFNGFTSALDAYNRP